jgi:secondary thiamine-phosphate synthase enzyme
MDTQVLVPQLGFVSSQIAIQTSGPRHFVDLTDDVQDRIGDSGLRSGLAVVTSLHTTASLLLNEHEPELLKDLDDFLARLAPEEDGYAHNAVPCLPGERPNGHAHCQALLLNASITLPFVDGRLAVGRYQRLFLVELDCSRPRRVTVTLLGS